MSKPKIYYFTHHCPFGPNYGARMRARHLAEILSEVADLRLVVTPLEPIPPEDLEKTAARFDIAGVIGFENAPKGLRGHLRNELDPYFRNTHGIIVEAKGRALIEQAMSENAILWFHGIRAANAFRIPSSANTVLDIDDIPSQLWSTSISDANGLIDKLRIGRKLFQWKRRESVLLNRFNAVCVCSKLDKKSLGEKSERLFVVPNGFTAEKEAAYVDYTPATPPRIGFIGTLEYKPNAAGVRWFIQNVWPSILEKHPDARLRLVGKNTDQVTGEGVDGLGWVDDATKEIASWAMTIVPIHIGGGTRIKIAEAFFRGCPIVSTRLGAYGYDVVSGGQLLHADEAPDFSEACLKILSAPELGRKLAENGSSFYKRGLSWESVRPNLESVVQSVVKRARTRSEPHDHARF